MAYGTTKTGPGRYAILTDAQGVQIGYAWCSDAGAIGFVPSTSTGVTMATGIRQGFADADKAKRTARQAFDALVTRKDTVVGKPVQTGDLGLLPA